MLNIRIKNTLADEKTLIWILSKFIVYQDLTFDGISYVFQFGPKLSRATEANSHGPWPVV